VNLLTLTILMATLLQFAPLADVLARLSAKTPIGSLLKTADWQGVPGDPLRPGVPAQLRETAQFSAGVESARVLQAIQDRIKRELSFETEDLGDGESIGFSRSRFIDKIRHIAREEGLTPTDPDIQGTMQDITSIPRLGMIHDIQTSRAEGFARWKADQDEGALQAYPAWEFTRVEARKEERPDWPERWQAAGGEFYEGRMIALKDSPVWEKLSIFGTPWPPFDFGSGMGLEEVDYDEAVRLGVLASGEQVTPGGQAFTDRLEASTAGLSEEFQDKLRVFFGDQVEFTDGKAKWVGANEAALQNRDGVVMNTFDPSQPRDSDGKWTGGEGSGSHVTDSPEFKAWFGDSKVVDKDGKPLVVYHGTTSEDFAAFDASRFNARSQGDAGSRSGFFFSRDAESAAAYAYDSRTNKEGIIKAVYLRIENPLILTKSPTAEDFKRAAREGRDGIQTPYEFVALRSKQIKSATGNSGKFSRTDPIITNTKPAEVDA